MVSDLSPFRNMHPSAILVWCLVDYTMRAMRRPDPIKPSAHVSKCHPATFMHDVDNLGVAHRATEALRRLMAAGPAATAVVRMGLKHDNPQVRVGCCKVSLSEFDLILTTSAVGPLPRPV